jgi:hypothetical protein
MSRIWQPTQAFTSCKRYNTTSHLQDFSGLSLHLLLNSHTSGHNSPQCGAPWLAKLIGNYGLMIGLMVSLSLIIVDRCFNPPNKTIGHTPYGSKHCLRRYLTLQIIVTYNPNTSWEGTWIHRDNNYTLPKACDKPPGHVLLLIWHRRHVRPNLRNPREGAARRSGSHGASPLRSHGRRWSTRRKLKTT